LEIVFKGVNTYRREWRIKMDNWNGILPLEIIFW
jgi:hypothetical protein